MAEAQPEQVPNPVGTEEPASPGPRCRPLEGVAAQVRRRGGDHIYPVALTFASNPSLFCGGL